jgi:hypothetical protein
MGGNAILFWPRIRQVPASPAFFSLFLNFLVDSFVPFSEKGIVQNPSGQHAENTNYINK